MSNRHAASHSVPRLKQKLGLLYARAPNIANNSDFGRLFKSPLFPNGIGGHSIGKWISSNQVPADRYARVVELFRRWLPGKRSASEVEDYLTYVNEAPLAEAFRAAPEINWASLMSTAKPARVKIIPLGPPDSFAITTRSSSAIVTGSMQFPVNERFRLKYLDAASGWLMVLQAGAGNWAMIDTGDEGPVLRHAGGSILLPREGSFGESDVGDRRYVLVVFPVPLPADLHSKAVTSAKEKAHLDVSTLDRLAAFLSPLMGLDVTVLNICFGQGC